ncbi:type I-E CRISPR-associated protein Cas7/Cse4/CasC [Streptomyces sp. NPDC004111]|uniref:type I-E CRISPR-associated protein Cas7/Cse4/CasC n=1 Tax=Streptomyces sp. NPDC004111 TaxID=3364690 RepID=UPI0036A8AD7B
MTVVHLDLSALQSYPLSCLNRGQDNEPKSFLYGNTMRTSISSQCQKRAWRLQMEDELGEPSARTRRALILLKETLSQAGWPETLATYAANEVARSATAAGLKMDRQEPLRTQSLFYLPSTTVQDLAVLCDTHRAALEMAQAQASTPADKDKKKAKSPEALPPRDVIALLTARTTTINLFGRMLAEVSGGFVAGALDVSHAFTVHTSDAQTDYFCAVEDWAALDSNGSAHLNEADHAAGVFYRYASINVTDLLQALEDNAEQTARVLELFADAFIHTPLQAKKTSTAPHTLPDLVHYTVRTRRPVSHANAFETPVRAARGGGYLPPARQALADHAATLERLTGTRHRLAHGHASADPDALPPLGTRHNGYEELIQACTRGALAPHTSRT